MRPGLVAITDLTRCAGAALTARVEAMAAAVPPGALAVQLRAKHLGGAALYAAAVELRAVTRAAGAALWVNDRLDVALAVDADGVHLPEAGMPVAAARAAAPGLAIGVSRHRADVGDDVALVQLGPIWATPSKAGMGTPLGLAALTAARPRVPGLLVAVGGVGDAPRAAAAIGAGADAVAAIRAWWDADDPAAVAAAWWRAIAAARTARE